MQLTIKNVGKQYRRNSRGLRNFTLELGLGVLGLLGPNGAGKSTLSRSCWWSSIWWMPPKGRWVGTRAE